MRKIIQFNNGGKEFLGLLSFLFLETSIENIGSTILFFKNYFCYFLYIIKYFDYNIINSSYLDYNQRLLFFECLVFLNFEYFIN